MRHIALLSVAFVLGGCSVDEEDVLQSNSSLLATSYVGCFVNQLGPDTYQPGYCALSARYPTTASFKLFTSDSPTFVDWRIYDSLGNQVPDSCSGLVCTMPIYFGQPLQARAIYVVNGTPTDGGYAVAEYEWEPPTLR